MFDVYNITLTSDLCVVVLGSTVVSTRARPAQPQQLEPAPPPPIQQPAQPTQAQTAQQLANGRNITAG